MQTTEERMNHEWTRIGTNIKIINGTTDAHRWTQNVLKIIKTRNNHESCLPSIMVWQTSIDKKHDVKDNCD